MSESSGAPTRFLFVLLGIAVLGSGGAFFWANKPPTAKPQLGTAVAQAASKPPAPPQKVLRPRVATKAERMATQKTIAAQLRAFGAGNWTEAVKFQSEALKVNFPTPMAFGQMITQTYPAFVNPKKVTYGDAVSFAGTIRFEVFLSGQDGSTTKATYTLVKEDGNYRIASVMGGMAPQTSGNANLV